MEHHNKIVALLHLAGRTERAESNRQINKGRWTQERADQREAGTVDKVAPTNDTEKRVKMRTKCKGRKCAKSLFTAFV